MPPNNGINPLSAEESVIGGLAGRYAVAMFEWAQEMGEADQNKLAEDLAALKILIDGTQDLQKLLKSPVINAEEQASALDAVLDKAGCEKCFPVLPPPHPSALKCSLSASLLVIPVSAAR